MRPSGGRRSGTWSTECRSSCYLGVAGSVLVERTRGRPVAWCSPSACRTARSVRVLGCRMARPPHSFIAARRAGARQRHLAASTDRAGHVVSVVPTWTRRRLVRVDAHEPASLIDDLNRLPGRPGTLTRNPTCIHQRFGHRCISSSQNLVHSTTLLSQHSCTVYQNRWHSDTLCLCGKRRAGASVARRRWNGSKAPPSARRYAQYTTVSARLSSSVY